MFKKFLLYAFRWQLSTPILAVCYWGLDDLGITLATVIANFIGACIFFFVDKWIFGKKKKSFKGRKKK